MSSTAIPTASMNSCQRLVTPQPVPFLFCSSRSTPVTPRGCAGSCYGYARATQSILSLFDSGAGLPSQSAALSTERLAHYVCWIIEWPSTQSIAFPSTQSNAVPSPTYAWFRSYAGSLPSQSVSYSGQ